MPRVIWAKGETTETTWLERGFSGREQVQASTTRLYSHHSIIGAGSAVRLHDQPVTRHLWRPTIPKPLFDAVYATGWCRTTWAFAVSGPVPAQSPLHTATWSSMEQYLGQKAPLRVTNLHHVSITSSYRWQRSSAGLNSAAGR